MAPASDVLIRALDLLEDGGWTQGTYARNAEGLSIGTYDPTAVSYCAHGAIFAAGDLLHVNAKTREEALDLLRKEIDLYYIPGWNDDPERTFSQVRETFRRAAFAGAAATEETRQVVCGAA